MGYNEKSQQTMGAKGGGFEAVINYKVTRVST